MNAIAPEARALDRARIALGVVFLVRTTPIVNVLPIPLGRVRSVLYGWPEQGFAFAWGGLVAPAGLQIASAIVRTLAALCFVLGIRPRIAGVVAGACGLFALSQDPFGFIFTLYTLFVGTIVLARRSPLLLRVFIATIYAWSALAKARSEWLAGVTLRALSEDALFTSWAASLFLAHDAMRVAAAWAVFLTELALPALLLLRKTRLAGVAIAVTMHIAFEAVARPDVMGLVMIALLLGLIDRGA